MAENIPKAGEIYLVRFHPAVGSELKKYRPALVISSTLSKIDNRYTAVMALTTKAIPKTKRYEIKLNVRDYDFLATNSYILTWYVRTIDRSRLVQKLGILDTQTQTEVLKKFKEVFFN